MEDCCAVCAEPLEWLAYGPCGHSEVCSTCTARLRFILDDECCCICKQECPTVFVTKALGDYTKLIKDFTTLPAGANEGKVGDYWFHSDTQAYFDEEIHYKMIKDMCRLSCSICESTVPKEPGNESQNRDREFKHIDQLRRHLYHVHKLSMCTLCIEGRKVFIGEQKLYTQVQLDGHLDKGDSEVDGSEIERGGFIGHPICDICKKRFYGDNELCLHMQTEHYTCHICQRRHPGHYDYYRNYNDLEAHFSQEHFLCENPDCLAKKFIVFATESELKRHNAIEHAGNMSCLQHNAALQVQEIVLECRESRLHALETIQGLLGFEDYALLEAVGLYHVALMPKVEFDRALLTALVERWRSETSTFQLPTGEMTITLEDVWRILRVPIRGVAVQISQDQGRALQRLTGDAAFPLVRSGIDINAAYARGCLDMQTTLLCALTSGFLVGDTSRRLIHWGWGEIVAAMRDQQVVYAWGPVVLARLYQILHRVVYKGGKSLVCCTLLQVWAWEHLAIMRPPGLPGQVEDQEVSVAFRWGRHFEVGQRRLHRGSLIAARRAIDDLMTNQIIWRPYRQHPRWQDDAYHLARVRRVKWLVGPRGERELHRFDRVVRQFGVEQGIPTGPVWFSRTRRERGFGGPPDPNTYIEVDFDDPPITDPGRDDPGVAAGYTQWYEGVRPQRVTMSRPRSQRSRQVASFLLRHFREAHRRRQRQRQARTEAAMTPVTVSPLLASPLLESAVDEAEPSRSPRATVKTEQVVLARHVASLEATLAATSAERDQLVGEVAMMRQTIQGLTIERDAIATRAATVGIVGGGQMVQMLWDQLMQVQAELQAEIECSTHYRTAYHAIVPVDRRLPSPTRTRTWTQSRSVTRLS